MEIVEMTLKDYEDIKDILIDEFDDFWRPSILESELKSENSKYIVAKENGEIVGFAGLWFSPIDAEITNIVTKKTERKRGIGTLLLGKLIEMAKEEKKDNISLEVNENNVAAGILYESAGFEVVGIRKNYYNGKDNAIIMTKYFQKNV
ncbi:MAG: ribosomal protein S18-alanine N-acetyltransferase [Clostridia bacterium]|nr:ribosomal protein S18-alanine N-acetyltransferase [Clostridia bacterium]